MEFRTHYDAPASDNRVSLTDLEDQYAYSLGIDIRKGEKIFGNNDKAFYKANWINQSGSPIVLIEKKRNRSSNEILFNLTLEHPHIIKTYGFVDPNDQPVEPDSVLLLQEYAKDGDLGSLLSLKHFIPKQNVLLEIFIQIADAMVYLSKHGVTHGDLACRNVLVFKSHPHDSSKVLVKLIDFGLTRNNSGLSDANTVIPVRYVGLEILLSRGRYNHSEKSEVYSFASFMWEACSFGEMPFNDIDDDNEVSRQKIAGKKLTRPNKCDPNIWKLMNLCWNDRPEDRPNFKTILTQLKIIQNVESSFPLSNSHSSSDLTEKNSSLFPIDYQICKNCNLRYTEYDSHLQNCIEHEQTCEQCFRQYRRGSYSEHKKVCNDRLDDDAVAKALDSSSKTDTKYNSRKTPLSTDNQRSTNSQYDKNDFNRSKSSGNNVLTNSSYQSDKRPSSVHSKPSSTPNERPAHRSSAKANTSQAKREQFPCEICENPFDASDLPAHQIQCLKKDNIRLELLRQKIERESAPTEFECGHCHRMYPIDELEKHQDKCSSNPNNVHNERQFLSSLGSIPDSDLYKRPTLFTSSNSSNEPIPTPVQPDLSWESIPNSRLPKNPVPTKKPPVQKNDNQLSGVRKFLSLFSFTKKKSKK